MRKILSGVLLAVILFGTLFPGCAAPPPQPDYSSAADWAFLPEEGAGGSADVFFVCPTVYFGTDTQHNMSLTDRKTKADFVGAINMEKGIYDEDTRFFAPYYRQAGLNVYTMAPEDREQYLQNAFADVLKAYDYYYRNYNGGRPIILAGFSQGADMCLRLVRERFNNETAIEQLIACYAIGWSITEEELERYPSLEFAQRPDDTGVIVSFNTEAEEIESSVIVPSGTKTLAINPLTWETDSTSASRILNAGACFPDADGAITEEIPYFTGAYIDGVRGTLKVTDVDETDYPPQLSIFEDGIYHVYDYQFFYRNLQENVRVRIEAYAAEHAAKRAEEKRAS